MIEYITTFIKAIPLAITHIPHFFRKLKNYKDRPPLKLTTSISHIEFLNAKGKIECPSFLTISIENIGSTELTIDLNQAYFNGESLRSLITHQFFSRTNEGTKEEFKLSTKNNLINLFRENWNTSKILKLAAHETLLIQIYPKESNDSMYFNIIKNSNILFTKNKFIVSLKINSTVFYYAVDRLVLLKYLVNHLVHLK